MEEEEAHLAALVECLCARGGRMVACLVVVVRSNRRTRTGGIHLSFISPPTLTIMDSHWGAVEKETPATASRKHLRSSGSIKLVYDVVVEAGSENIFVMWGWPGHNRHDHIVRCHHPLTSQ